MKALRDLFFYLSLAMVAALGISIKVYFITVLALGILLAVVAVQLYAAYWDADRVRQNAKLEKTSVLTKKYKAAKNSRSLPFKTGLFIALASVISAFTYTSPLSKDDVVISDPYEDDDDKIEVIREIRFKKPPPKVVPKVKPKKAPPKITTRIIVVPDSRPEPRVAPKFITPSTKVEDLIQTAKTKTVFKLPERKPLKDEYGVSEIDHMVIYPGCDTEGLSNWEIKECTDEALQKFFGRNASYPRGARELGLEGLVTVSFVFGINGLVENIEIIKAPGYKDAGGLGKEVQRVIKKLPVVVPAQRKGKPVKLRYTTNFRFQLH